MNSPNSDGPGARLATLHVLIRIAEPVLTALSDGQLHTRMPVETGETTRDLAQHTHLEALGRLMAGIAPWLELGPEATEEGRLRERFIDLAVKAIGHAFDPKSSDYMNFSKGIQPLMDLSFLIQGLLRAPRQLWGNLGKDTQAHLIKVLKTTRPVKPHPNNWLLSSAMVEVALWKFTGECRMPPITKAVNEFLGWYMGDGVYGDGPFFHWDYYNSYAIQPMLFEVVRICAERKHPLGRHFPLVLERAGRYAAVQERMISPEATFPVIGRSSCYRFGAFQTLSLMALERQLPWGLDPASVRGALTAVIRRMMEAPGTFDEKGWLQVGVVGQQLTLADPYISTGSLYLCSVGLLHLGLPAGDPFWTDPDQPWTQKRIWSGENVARDHAIDDGEKPGLKKLAKSVLRKLKVRK
jgi:hypothetical protein